MASQPPSTPGRQILPPSDPPWSTRKRTGSKDNFQQLKTKERKQLNEQEGPWALELAGVGWQQALVTPTLKLPY